MLWDWGMLILLPRLSSDDTANISECDVTGVLYANQWKLMNNDIEPESPKEEEIDC